MALVLTEALHRHETHLVGTQTILTQAGAYTDPVIVAEYIAYISSQRKKLLPYVFEQDAVEILRLLAESKKITKKNLEQDYLLPAMQCRAEKCTAFLESLAAILVCLCIWNCRFDILRPAFVGILVALAGLETRCILDAKAGRPLLLMRWERRTTSLVRMAEVSRATSSPAIFCSALLCRMLSFDLIARYPAFAASVL